MGRKRANPSSNGATLGFEATLWAAADKLRGHIGELRIRDAETLVESAT